MKKQKTKVVEKVEESLAERVAKLADRFGVGGEHVRKLVERDPTLLKGTRWGFVDVTEGVALHANRINRDALQELISRYGANRPKVLEATKALADQLPLPVSKQNQVLESKAVLPAREVQAKSKPPQPEPKPRPTIFGKPVTGVLLWMGREGWTFQQALRVICRLDLATTDLTVRTQLRAGMEGQSKSRTSELSSSEAEKLYEMARRRKKSKKF